LLLSYQTVDSDLNGYEFELELIMSKSKDFILNCVPSLNIDGDWTVEDALMSGVLDKQGTQPNAVDLRTKWWPADNQGRTGACVGFATAYGVLRWHYVRKGVLRKSQKPSARFIWMANKETDDITHYPTTFLDSCGTQTKVALRVAQRYGCVLDSILPMKGQRCTLGQGSFYAMAARLRITGYHNLGRDLNDWRLWLAQSGPILTRLNVDAHWNHVAADGKLDAYDATQVSGGHAVCLVGYTPEHFIVRNSWGESWGDHGFAYASNSYVQQAFTEAYGVTV
jgi:hypothetical protein